MGVSICQVVSTLKCPFVAVRHIMLSRGCLISSLCIALVAHVSAHGWVTSPVSKNELEYHHFQWHPEMPKDFQYEPQTSNHGNGIGQKIIGDGFSCGAANASTSYGLSLWQQWYDAAGVTVPHITPGTDWVVNATLTIDHGGQAWMSIACADKITEANNWTLLERSQSDRTAHFMPSAPGAFAWAPLEYIKKGGKMSNTWAIPEDFSCPAGHGVARWVWKTGNSCNDVNNIGRSTEKFSNSDFAKVVKASTGQSWVNQPCKSPPESFISCLDFTIGDGPTPPPGPPTPPGPPPPPAPCTDPVKAYGQCGGTTWSGSTCCDKGCSCTGADKFKQCEPPKGKWAC